MIVLFGPKVSDDDIDAYLKTRNADAWEPQAIGEEPIARPIAQDDPKMLRISFDSGNYLVVYEPDKGWLASAIFKDAHWIAPDGTSPGSYLYVYWVGYLPGGAISFDEAGKPTGDPAWGLRLRRKAMYEAQNLGILWATQPIHQAGKAPKSIQPIETAYDAELVRADGAGEVYATAADRQSLPNSSGQITNAIKPSIDFITKTLLDLWGTDCLIEDGINGHP